MSGFIKWLIWVWFELKWQKQIVAFTKEAPPVLWPLKLRAAPLVFTETFCNSEDGANICSEIPIASQMGLKPPSNTIGEDLIDI